MSSISQSITTRENEAEVDSLTDLLVNSMSVNDRQKSSDINASPSNCKYLSLKYLLVLPIFMKTIIM